MAGKCENHDRLENEASRAANMFGRIEEHMRSTNENLDALFKLYRASDDKIHKLDLKIVGIAKENPLDANGNDSGFSFKANKKVAVMLIGGAGSAIYATVSFVKWIVERI